MPDSKDNNGDDKNVSDDTKNQDAENKNENDIEALLNDPKVKALIEAQAASQLKEIKDKLDGAFSQRDKAVKDLSDAKKAASDAEAARLEKEGKLTEAMQVRITQLEAEKAEAERIKLELEARNTELTRDSQIEGYLSVADFKNAKAKNSALREIRDMVSKNDKGQWVGENNVPLVDVIKSFLIDADNAFLLKTVAQSGSGVSDFKGKTDAPGRTKKLSEMTQAEVIKLAQEGRL